MRTQTTLFTAALATAFAAGVSANAASLSVTDGLVTWYDAALDTYSDGAGTTASTLGGNVRWWGDQGALAGNNIVQQGGASAQPTLQTAGAGDGLNATHNVIRFDGGDNLLALDGANDGGDPFGSSLDGTNLTWFIVSRQDASATDRLLGAQDGAQADKWGSFYQSDDIYGHTRTGGSFQGSNADVSPAGDGISTLEFTINSTVWDGTNRIIAMATDADGNYVQGAENSNGGDSSGAFNRFRLGAASGGSTGLNGDIAEVLIYNQTLSGRERAKIEGYLFDKYFRTSGDDVVLYYEFDDQNPGTTGATSSTVTDLSGNGHTGVITGASLEYVAGDTTGHMGSTALEFEDDHATHDRVVASASGDFAFDADTESFTVETVFRFGTTTDGGDDPALVSNQGTGGEWWLRLENGNTARFGVAGSGGGTAFSATSGDSLDDGEWHHVAAVYDAADNVIRVYVDFELFSEVAATITGTIGRSDRDLFIGEFNSLGDSRSYDGAIDMVRITRGALAPAQFLTMVPSPGALPAGLILLGVAAMRRARRG